MKCLSCNGTGKCKQPVNQEEFEIVVDKLMDRQGFMNYHMAEIEAYRKVDYLEIPCPDCAAKQSLSHNG